MTCSLPETKGWSKDSEAAAVHYGDWMSWTIVTFPVAIGAMKLI